MKEQNFIDSITGENSTVPWSPEAALKNKHTKWMDRNGCIRCKTEGRLDGKKVRYLKDNSCTFCLMHDAHELWPQWVQGDPGRPEPWSTSPEVSQTLGIDWYYGSPNHDILCSKGPHLRKTSIITGRCVDCDNDLLHFRALLKGPRASARFNGRRYYTPTSACPDCGQMAQRHVVTNGCTGCLKKIPDGRRSASQIFAEQNPNAILSKNDASVLGFTLFRTGEPCSRNHTAWRYVSTTNCVECLKLIKNPQANPKNDRHRPGVA